MTARTLSSYGLFTPAAANSASIVVLRSGSGRLLGEFGTHDVNLGKVVVLPPNTPWAIEPEGWVTATTLNLDQDYVVDLMFWRHAARFTTRDAARLFLEVHCAGRAQLILVGEQRIRRLTPWLDELSALSLKGIPPNRFYRAQALVACVLDVVAPRLTVDDDRGDHPSALQLRREAREVAALLRESISRRWTVTELAEAAHLSSSQLRRVFKQSFGVPPITYLTGLRTQQMALLLRTTGLSIPAIAMTVGWADADFATRQFRRSVGTSPREYRRRSRQTETGVFARSDQMKRP